MLRSLTLGAMVAGAAAIACPPIEEASQQLKAAGEQCRGPCGQFGECQEGLKCIVPQTTGMSFAILLAPERPGVCTRPEMVEEAETPGRKLATAGGAADLDVKDPEMLAAVEAGLAILREKNLLGATGIKMTSILLARKQVVAGVLYKVWFLTSDSKMHELQVTDQAWLQPRYQVHFHSISSDSGEN
eukprot:CAMPEP_0115851586 /NCGR_PEP_ID=MMETSP0287-20121206/12559_1 /TAXON_ID=412157 /ORGANISM="Chrysochromulina rotalis, Strain UIO044" /LENGTH=186 /DNA_ID=CAMNT_0003305625 /DNA_START=38 /DNA_END=598 /DNA_ORIENTATION=-